MLFILGSIIEIDDMLDYCPRKRKPTQITLQRNATILYSASLPGSGDVLAFMLNILEGYSETEFGKSTPKNGDESTLFYHRLVESFKYGFAHRSRLEDDDRPEIKEVAKYFVRFTRYFLLY